MYNSIFEKIYDETSLLNDEEKRDYLMKMWEESQMLEGLSDTEKETVKNILNEMTLLIMPKVHTADFDGNEYLRLIPIIRRICTDARYDLRDVDLEKRLFVTNVDVKQLISVYEHCYPVYYKQVESLLQDIGENNKIYDIEARSTAFFCELYVQFIKGIEDVEQ